MDANKWIGEAFTRKLHAPETTTESAFQIPAERLAFHLKDCGTLIHRSGDDHRRTVSAQWKDSQRPAIVKTFVCDTVVWSFVLYTTDNADTTEIIHGSCDPHHAARFRKSAVCGDDQTGPQIAPITENDGGSVICVGLKIGNGRIAKEADVIEVPYFFEQRFTNQMIGNNEAEDIRFVGSRVELQGIRRGSILDTSRRDG
ncbi:MAG: hypothetical protein R3E82_21645 [Pseudomonadales bacterium]